MVSGLRYRLRLNTEVVSIDRASQRLSLSGDTSLAYDALLLTTGARARTVSLVERDDPRVFYIRSIDDTLALKTKLRPGVRLVVIGAGFIGLEIAATARKAGCAVTVLERADQPLARVVPTEVGKHVAAPHRSRGVDLQFCCSVQSTDTTASSCFYIHPTGAGPRRTSSA